MTDIRISEIIAPPFHVVHRAVKSGVSEDGVPKTHFWLKGGRGSTKSSFWAIELVLGIKRDPTANGVVVRKVADTLRDSVYAQVLWAIDILGCSAEFRSSVSPMEIVYKPTGQRILFRGADKPEKLKSLKMKSGYVKYIVFEELDQFRGMNEIRSILQSLMRGGDDFRVFYSYNPPRSRDNWVNREVLTERDDRMVHTSTYLDVPKHWLGTQFLVEAAELERTKPTAYAHEYLGDITGTGGVVFENVRIEALSDERVADFDRLHNGLDFGWFPDPSALTRMHFAAAQNTLYVFDELVVNRTKNAELADLIKTRLGEVRDGEGKVTVPHRRELIMCDSAEPQNIVELYDLGLDTRGVKKGPGSVEFGIKWLQSLDAIVIDNVRCPVAAMEFTVYEYERTPDGEYCSTLPDANNHTIDSVRYAMQPVIASRGAVAGW